MSMPASNQPVAATKTAVIGASGFIGRHLLHAYRNVYPDTIGTSFSKTHAGLIPFDLRQPELSGLQLQEKGYEAILICSSKPNIAYCEQFKDEAHAVNVRGTLDLVRQASAMGLTSIFLSSDYVFDGTDGGYDDLAPTNPSTEYGRQKQQVEKEIPNLTDRYLVLRLSKIYGTQKGDNTLLDEIASSLSAGREIRAAGDMIFSPTHVLDLVEAIQKIQQRRLTGLLNVCAPQPWSRYQVAVAMARALGVDQRLVRQIQLHDIPALAGRPLNTSMVAARLQKEVGATFIALETSIAQLAFQWTKE